jgi:hypothetical protein
MIVNACVGAGSLAGAAMGIALSAPSGLVASTILGGVVGAVAGVVIDREDRRASARTRELDAMLGINGVERGGGSPSDVTGTERERELRAWVTEWMTPQPPHVR